MSSIEDDDSPPFSSSEDHNADHDVDERVRPDSFQQIDDEDQSMLDDDRLNRFTGPASTWLKYTQDERGLIRSLQQQEANDLSVHLYNTHGLKARLHDHDTASKVRPWSSKLRWVKPREDGTRPWQPEPQWTAWPLHSDDVPRSDETFWAINSRLTGIDRAVASHAMYIPSTELQGELEALMLKYGKSQFRTREWTQAGNFDVMSMINLDSKTVNTKEAHDGSFAEGNEDCAVPSLSAIHDKFVSPAFMADETEASSILQQPVRHLITNLDGLLSALHKSRAGHGRSEAQSRSRSRSRSRSKSMSRPVAASDGDLLTESALDSEPDIDEASTVTKSVPAYRQTTPTSKQYDRPRTHEMSQCGLRDWSDVLGMASLVGWDEDVIDRAAKRCATLFGESIEFRIMPETAHETLQDKLVQYIPNMIQLGDLPEEEKGAETSPLESFGGSNDPEQWTCPHATCPRHENAYYQGFRWREHLKKTHKHSKADIERIEKTYHASHSRVRTRSDQPRLTVFPCLVDSCKYREQPFVVRYRWADHLRRRHRYTDEDINNAEQKLLQTHKAVVTNAARGTPRTETSASAVTDKVDDRDGIQEESKSLMVGGVHNDGFMEPIRVGIYQRRRRRKRKTSGPREEETVGDDEVVVIQE
nr:hypothetical protein CFP56_09259 [Quercus suber]